MILPLFKQDSERPQGYVWDNEDVPCHNFGQCYSTMDAFVKIYEIVYLSLANQYVNRVSKQYFKG